MLAAMTNPASFLFSRCVCKDVTESVFVRRSLELTNEILMASQQCEDLHVICQKALVGIQALFECECVGIRLLDEQGNIPYEVYQGFPEEFYDKESPLTIHVRSLYVYRSNQGGPLMCQSPLLRRVVHSI